MNDKSPEHLLHRLVIFVSTCLSWFTLLSLFPPSPGRAPPGAAADGAQVKVFLYEMASIGMRARTAQRYVEAVSLQYKLQAAARNRLSVRVSSRYFLRYLPPSREMHAGLPAMHCQATRPLHLLRRLSFALFYGI